MKPIEITFYKESGRFNPGNLAIAVLTLLPISLILGYAYGVLVFYMPFIYLNVLATVFAGVTLLFILEYVFRFLKIRNKNAKIITAGFAGLIVWYAQWCVTLFVLYNEELPGLGDYASYLLSYLHPAFFSELITINEYGMWEMFGIMFSGVILGVIWLIEFVILIGFPIYTAIKTSSSPYSEQFDKWYDREYIEQTFRIVTTSTTTDLYMDPLSALENLSRGRASVYSYITIYTLPRETSHYLSFTNVSFDSENKKSEEQLIDPILITSAELQSIRSGFNTISKKP